MSGNKWVCRTWDSLKIKYQGRRSHFCFAKRWGKNFHNMYTNIMLLKQKQKKIILYKSCYSLFVLWKKNQCWPWVAFLSLSWLDYLLRNFAYYEKAILCRTTTSKLIVMLKAEFLTPYWWRIVKMARSKTFVTFLSVKKKKRLCAVLPYSVISFPGNS